MKSLLLVVLLAVACLCCSNNSRSEDPDSPSDGETGVVTVTSDLWAAADPLARVLPDNSLAGNKRNNKTVAMFYWTWHNPDMASYATVGNISQIIREYPEALNDKNHSAWDRGGGNTHFWGEPLFGYYRTTDEWVLRKHAEMFADAGVDAVFFDCTNGSLTWKESYEALMATWDKARNDGVNVPKVAFLLPFGAVPNSLVSLRQLYRDVYKPGRYKDLWFIWKGKPCIMAYSDNLTDSEEDRAIASFFTFRPGQPDYVDGPSRNDQWGWLEVYPQHVYGAGEQTTVGVAQNTSPDRGGHCGAFNVPDAYGRSYTSNGWDDRPDSHLYGANFQQQWDFALSHSSELIFVTGWNEYIAGKWDRGTEAGDHWNGYPFSFVDQFDWEHSRDIEPNNEWFADNGSYLGDTYYYQLITNIRRYKGVSKPVYASAVKTINIGSFDGWNDVSPDFTHYPGNTAARNHRGHADKFYTDNTGRNDIVKAKVARDDKYVYFYVETKGDMTNPSNSAQPNWMWLMINTDRKRETGWEGYDYMLNYKLPVSNKGIVSKSSGNKWQWDDAGEFAYAVKGNKMEIKLSRSILGLNSAIDLEFKWLDNVTVDDEFNVSYFYKYGDAAPGGRFNFVYTSTLID